MSSHFATPRKPQPPTFWVEPAAQKPADNPVDRVKEVNRHFFENDSGDP